MMKWIKFFLPLVLILQAFADQSCPYEYSADIEKNEAFTGSLKKEIARPLHFFIENFPKITTNPKNGKLQPLEWRPLKSTDPILSIDRIEAFHGQLIVVNFIRRDLLKKGTLRKSGLMLLRPKTDDLYKLVYLAEQGSADVVETYSIKSERLLNEEEFLCVTCHYSGSGGIRQAQYFRWKESNLIRHDIWADKPRFRDEIKAAGWELWHRGHWSEPENKAEFITAYRPPKNANGGRSGHAQIKIEYEWEGEQLVAKRWKITP